jgi:hypothetical protein
MSHSYGSHFETRVVRPPTGQGILDRAGLTAGRHPTFFSLRGGGE